MSSIYGIIAAVSFLVFLFMWNIAGFGGEYYSFIALTVTIFFTLMIMGEGVKDEDWRKENSKKIWSGILIITLLTGSASYCYARNAFGHNLEQIIKNAVSVMEKSPDDPSIYTPVNDRKAMTEKQTTQALAALNAAKDASWKLGFYDDIKETKWLSDFHHEGYYIFCYAEAIKIYHETQGPDSIEKALNLLGKIPLDYEGELSEKIRNMRAALTARRDEYKQLAAVANEENKRKAEEKAKADAEKAKADAEYRASHLYLDDPESKIYDIMGQPDNVNRIVNQFGETKQFVYYRGSKMICIYTENGFITDFQD